MLSKLFGKKSGGNEDFDPISAYINNICSRYRTECDMNVSLEDAVFSVIDTETTGLDLNTAKIINIAAVKVQNFKIIDFYNAFINPGIEIPKESIKWHGITDDMVVDKPSAAEVMPDFLNFVGSSILIGHHVNFDVKMINKEMKESFGCDITNPWLDTMLIYTRSIIKKDAHVSLDYLFDIYKVTCNGRHTALGDALATAEVFTKMIQQANNNYRSVAELRDSQKAFVV